MSWDQIRVTWMQFQAFLYEESGRVGGNHFTPADATMSRWVSSFEKRYGCRLLAVEKQIHSPYRSRVKS